MTDFADLAALVASTRSDMLADDRREADRRAGLTALRPSIDQLDAHVRPLLEIAKEALGPAGIKLEVQDGWTDPGRKAATLAIVCTPAGAWPARVGVARSRRFIIEATAGELRVRSRPFHVHDDSEAVAIEAAPGAETETAVRLAVENLLTVIGEGPTMRGDMLRGFR